MSWLLFVSFTGDKEVLTEGKLLLLGCENKMLQGYGLHSRKKVTYHKNPDYHINSIKCPGGIVFNKRGPNNNNNTSNKYMYF